MENIKETIKKRKIEKTNSRSERAFIIEQFLKRLNQERKQQNIKIYKKFLKIRKVEDDLEKRTKFQKSKHFLKPLSPSLVAIKMGHIKNNEDLRWFLKNCEQARCGFSKAWWGGLKI
jgi:hypothetical protein